MSEPNYLKRALELARIAAAEDEVPVGAVVVYQGKVVGEGYNTRERDQSALRHAELVAIEAASHRLGSWRLVDCELYVTLEPCLMCLSACQQARIRRVIYGAPDPKGGALALGYRIHEDPRVHHRFEVIFQSEPECSKILSDFFLAKRHEHKNRKTNT